MIRKTWIFLVGISRAFKTRISSDPIRSWPLLVLLVAVGAVQPLYAGDMTISYTHTDVHGNVIAVTDENQNVIERRQYEPYGLPQAPINDDTGFTGHLHDGDTGLVYMQQRYYDPMTGQFLSTDPVLPNEADGSNFNRYWYANNNPYKYVDPNGELAVALVIFAPELIALAKATVLVGSAYVVAAEINSALNEQANSPGNESTGSPDVPDNLVGEKDGKGGRQGNRENSGPLSSDNGGTGDADKDFEKLTGGNHEPAPEGKGFPEGTRVGENGISIRPAIEDKGARIDIPAKGDKPHETLHYKEEHKQ